MSIEVYNTRLIQHGGSAKVAGPGAASFRVAKVRKSGGGDGAQYETRQGKGTGSASAIVASRDIKGLVTSLTAAAGDLVVSGDVLGQANPKKITLTSALAFALGLTIPSLDEASTASGQLTYWGLSSDGSASPIAVADNPTPAADGAIVEGFYVKGITIGGDAIDGARTFSVTGQFQRKASNAGDGNLWQVQQARGRGAFGGTIGFGDVAAMLTALEHAAGSLVVTVGVVGQVADVAITCAGAQFFSLDSNWPDNNSQAISANSLGFGLVSSDGATVPVSIGDAA